MMFCHACNRPSGKQPYCREKCTKLDRALVDRMTYRLGDKLVPTAFHSGDVAEKGRAQKRLVAWDAQQAQGAEQ